MIRVRIFDLAHHRDPPGGRKWAKCWPLTTWYGHGCIMLKNGGPPSNSEKKLLLLMSASIFTSVVLGYWQPARSTCHICPKWPKPPCTWPIAPRLLPIDPNNQSNLWPLRLEVPVNCLLYLPKVPVRQVYGQKLQKIVQKSKFLIFLWNLASHCVLIDTFKTNAMTLPEFGNNLKLQS